MSDRYLTVTEVAELLGCSTKTVRRRITSGDLPAQRLIGSQLIRIHPADVQRLMRPIPHARMGGAA